MLFQTIEKSELLMLQQVLVSIIYNPFAIEKTLTELSTVNNNVLISRKKVRSHVSKTYFIRSLRQYLGL